MSVKKPDDRRRATGRAFANVALAKYWGKADVDRNLPAVPSLSAGIEGLWTETTITLDPDLTEDELTINGRLAQPHEMARVSALLDVFRSDVGCELRAGMFSLSNIPLSAGLASSASAFAALALAANGAFDAGKTTPQLSVIARRGSGSAARSLFGGYVELQAAEAAEQGAVEVAAADHLPLTVIIAIVDDSEKSVSSREGMIRCAETSPFYGSWLETARISFEEIKQALLSRRFDLLAQGAEHNCLAMHALMLTANPPLLYWKPTTLAVVDTVQTLRNKGIPAFFTIDAGPNVFVFCPQQVETTVIAALEELPVELKLTWVGGKPMVATA